MLNSIKKFFIDLLYENGKPSRTGLIAMVNTVLFVIVTLQQAFTNGTWQGYAILAAACGIGGPVLQGVNKFINSRYNSLDGKYPDKGGM